MGVFRIFYKSKFKKLDPIYFEDEFEIFFEFYKPNFSVILLYSFKMYNFLK